MPEWQLYKGRPIGEGMPILFVITKGKGSISERAEPFEDVDIKDIDNDYYIGHQIIPAALRVLTVLGVTEEELLGESLKSFLKWLDEKMVWKTEN